MSTFVPVAAHLARLAAEQPQAAALHIPQGRVAHRPPSPHRTYSYAELNALVDAAVEGFRSVGVGPGSRVAVMVPPNLDFFVLTFALLRMAAIPILIDPGMGAKNLGRCLADAEPTVFLGIPKAQLAQRLFGWGRDTIRIRINVGQWRWGCDAATGSWRRATRPVEPAPVQPEELAAILFTSGSTGVAKGAIYTQGIFAAQVELLRTVYQIEPGEVDLCTFPLFALFGPALGMSCVVPDMNASRPITLDPRRILSQMRQFEVTNFFGSPAVLRRLMEVTASEPPIPSLRRILSAGAPVTAEVIEFMQPIQPPGVELFTPYGATEALPVANMSSQEILRETAQATSQGAGICIGRPFPQVTVRIIAITDEPIPNWADVQELPVGAIGELCVCGPIVTPGYVRRPEQTRLAKILDGETLWHRMGDVGYLDEQGRIWYCGRKSHRVETKQGPLFTECVEGIFNTVVQRSALVGVTRNGITYPVLCVDQSFRRQSGVRYRLPSWDELVVQLRGKAAERPLTQPIQTFLNYPKPGFPVDVRHNAKIFREKLALWADQQLGPAWNGEATP